MQNLLKKILFSAAFSITVLSMLAQNPILPMWEYIPDGEPYVFEDPDRPGHLRVYLYGSHDTRLTDYCGKDQVVWSADVKDLTNWRYDGKIFESIVGSDGKRLKADGEGDVLYAPDVACITEPDGSKTYYLYPNNQEGGRNGMVARSKRPDGPFEVINWNAADPTKTDGILGADPSVFVDTDGRVYGYWGFNYSHGAELDPTTMATVKPGCEIVNGMIPEWQADQTFRFFEASSMRRIEDKYVFVYSRFTRDGEFGLPIINYTLAYAYGDNPLGPFTYGGTLVDGRARGIDEDGDTIPTASPYGNTHGGLVEINGKWWIFYHRQTGRNEYSRQAMVAPVEIQVEKGKGGKVTITEAEITSEGFAIEGLNPLHRTAAGTACYLVGPGKAYKDNFNDYRPYIKPTYYNPASMAGPFNNKMPFCPVTNITSGSTIGYKYFNFNQFKGKKDISLICQFLPTGINARVKVVVGSPYLSKGGKVIGAFEINAGDANKMVDINVPITGIGKIKGKQPLYFIFESNFEKQSIADFYSLQFKAN